MAIVENSELQISRKIVQKLLMIPKALMERLTKWTELNPFFISDRRGILIIMINYREALSARIAKDSNEWDGSFAATCTIHVNDYTVLRNQKINNIVVLQS